MPGTKCPTVRSDGTIRVRSALMPILMISRASMGGAPHHSVVPALSRDPYRVMSEMGTRADAFQSNRRLWLWVPAFAGTTVRLLLRRRRALHKRLATLHLVGQRSFVDLDHDRVGIDAEILHERLRDVAHHAGLLFIGAAGGHAHGNFRHFCHSLFVFPLWPGNSAKRVFTPGFPAIHDLLYQTRRGCPAQGRA